MEAKKSIIRNVANNIYSISLNNLNVAPGASVTDTFDISNAGKQFGIRSIAFDYDISISGIGGLRLQDAQNNTQIIQMLVGQSASVVPKITRSFANPAPAASIGFQGECYLIWKKQQLFFESFFIDSLINFSVLHTNNDALVTYDLFASVIVEIYNLD